MGLARTVLLVLVAATACAASQQTPTGPAASASAPPAGSRLPPTWGTTCCLAGGWCPARELLEPAASPALQGSHINELTSSGSGSSDSQHKPLLPLSDWDAAGIGAAALALLLAASGGIGGGAILVPLYLMVLGFSTASAVALSNITIVGGTLANLAFNSVRRHPLRPGQPLIDWDLILVMEPSTILGALAGGYLNKVLPGWLTTVSLSLLLSFIAYNLAAKAAEIRDKERAALAGSLEPVASGRVYSGGLLGGGVASDAAEPLLQPLLGSNNDGGGGSGGGSERGPSPLSPLALRPSSATSSSSGLDESGSSWATARDEGSVGSLGSVVGTPPAAAGVVTPWASPLRQLTPSEPVPIEAGRQDGVLPLLTPVALPPDSEDGRRDLEAPAVVDESPPWGGKPGGAPGAPHMQQAKPPAAPGTSCGGSGGQPKPQAERFLRPHVPLKKLAVLLLLLAGVIGSDLLKHQAVCPSLAYWIRATAMVPATVATLLAVRAYLISKAAMQRTAGHELLEGDVEWTPRTTLLYPLLCSFAGLCAGIFGVGGGIIKGPLMLEMGVLPEVAAATSATMIFFTSISASVVFISFGAVQWDYAAALFTMGIVSTAVGQLLVMWVNRYLRSRSLLVIIMALVLGISAVALAVQGYTATVAAAHAGALWRFHDVCGNAAL